MVDAARRDRRYRIRIPAIVLRGKDELLLWTEDVSYRGAFVAVDPTVARFNPRQLVRVRMMLPPDAREVELHAMIVYVSRARVPGLGAQFYAMDASVRARWDEFIGYAKAYHPEAGASSLDARPAASKGAPREQLSVAADELLRAILAHNDTVFVRTDAPFAVGDVVHLSATHATTGAVFPLGCVVRRAVAEHGTRGVGVEITGLDPVLRDELAAFVDTGELVAHEESPYSIDEDDPRFA
jgi:hypothetical protein